MFVTIFMVMQLLVQSRFFCYSSMVGLVCRIDFQTTGHAFIDDLYLYVSTHMLLDRCVSFLQWRSPSEADAWKLKCCAGVATVQFLQ